MSIAKKSLTATATKKGKPTKGIVPQTVTPLTAERTSRVVYTQALELSILRSLVDIMGSALKVEGTAKTRAAIRALLPKEYTFTSLDVLDSNLNPKTTTDPALLEYTIHEGVGATLKDTIALFRDDIPHSDEEVLPALVEHIQVASSNAWKLLLDVQGAERSEATSAAYHTVRESLHRAFTMLTEYEYGADFGRRKGKGVA